MKHVLTSVTLGLASFAAPVTADPASWRSGPFDMPESVVFDAARKQIVVSVIQGHPGEADGNGHLALLSPDGQVLDPHWVTGLDAPKGMAIVGDKLLIADLTRLHEVDLSTGALLRSLDVAGAVFLNDVTSDGTQAFVSDFMGNRIWHYQAGQMTVWLEEGAIAHPNGLLLETGRLVVGAWGTGMQDDFSTEGPGALLSVDLETRQDRHACCRPWKP